MTKDLFIKILDNIKESRELQEQFCYVLEKLSPGCYCDCFLYSKFEDLCYNIFSEEYGDDNTEIIMMFTCDENFCEKGPLKLNVLESEVIINNAEDLYDFLEYGIKCITNKTSDELNKEE